MDVTSYTEQNDVGGRLRTLRLRYGLTLVEVARGAGLDVSYLSRLERDALQNAKPKPDTISRVLDAIGATLSEREATYHIERPPLTAEEIASQVKEIADELDDSPEATILGDEHWHIHYFNRTARAALGLTREEYPAAAGVHMLTSICDPSQPRYSRIPDDEREAAFESRARMFKSNFAGEQFDRWYLKVVADVCRYPWAAAIWESPEPHKGIETIGRDDTTILNPVVGKLRVHFQLNPLLSNPRFFLANWAPVSDDLASILEELRQRPEYAYPIDLSSYAPGPLSGTADGRSVAP